MRGSFGHLSLGFHRRVYSYSNGRGGEKKSKDVSNLRTKGIMLERAMRELEKVVAESRLSTMEVQDIDASSTTIKRRLPCEVKQKLAKVARLAHSSQGKISKELINKLMNILGHSVQLRTLKRNLKEMILMGISAKQEKAYRFEQIKLEVIEMIKSQASMLGDVPTGDIQEVLGYEEKVALKKQYSMDNVIEDKICDLYDLYTQGIDEDKGTQIRKLYVEHSLTTASTFSSHHFVSLKAHGIRAYLISLPLYWKAHPPSSCSAEFCRQKLRVQATHTTTRNLPFPTH
ncbi:hypothetical protein GOBAR_AA17070 [Gossypium barbadense]|uniref:Uncharacterized protein n=1 Tax=Gossypium barbadense TaxID=3634 RepID=A0A2P5XJR0_GOSBA|nr:hypothetical protein GOBAR_AA17070 [Gossypium barbadense]